MGNVYGYVRVSSYEQNVERQIIAMFEAGVESDRIYIDKQSGKDFDRPSYHQMLDMLHAGDLIYVLSIDRL